MEPEERKREFIEDLVGVHIISLTFGILSGIAFGLLLGLIVFGVTLVFLPLIIRQLQE